LKVAYFAAFNLQHLAPKLGTKAKVVLSTSFHDHFLPVANLLQEEGKRGEMSKFIQQRMLQNSYISPGGNTYA